MCLCIRSYACSSPHSLPFPPPPIYQSPSNCATPNRGGSSSDPPQTAHGKTRLRAAEGAEQCNQGGGKRDILLATACSLTDLRKLSSVQIHPRVYFLIPLKTFALLQGKLFLLCLFVFLSDLITLHIKTMESWSFCIAKS